MWSTNTTLFTQYVSAFRLKSGLSMHVDKNSRTRLKQHRFVRHLVYNARYSVLPSNSSLLTITLHCSVTTTLVYNVKGKGKVQPRTGHKGPERELRYSFPLSLTSLLDGVGGQRHAPAALPPRKTRYPLYRRLGGPQDRSGRVRKISPPPEFDPRTVQPVATRYTD